MILNRLRDHAFLRPSENAFIVLREGRATEIDYQAFWHEVERWAGHFSALGLPRGSVVFIVLKHSLEQYYAFLGAMRAGLIPSFLAYATPKQNAQLYWATHRELFRYAGPGALITYADNVAALAEAASGVDAPVLSTDDLLGSKPGTLPTLSGDEDDVAFLQFSSGTTGLKKGVQIKHRQLQSELESYAAAIRFGPADRIVSWLPLYHDLGLIACYLLPTYFGASVVSIDPFEWVGRPEMMFEAISKYKATICWMPNFAFAHLVRTVPEEARYDLSSMRAFISGSEPCRPAAVNSFVGRFGSFGVDIGAIQIIYGMAEAVLAVSQSNLDEVPRTLVVSASRLARDGEVLEVPRGSADAQEFLSCGAAIRDVSIRIKPDGLFPRSATVGEIQVAGSFVFDGYYKNPDADKGAFDTDGWYNTGDIGFLHDGELYVCGRKKEMLIVHGRNFYANDIEQVLNRVRGVKPGRVVVFGLFDETTQSEGAVALVESDPKVAVDPRVLRRAIKKAVYDELELTLRSVEVMRPESLIKTTSGKTSRSENLRRYLERRHEPAEINV